jgi:hypothetical protein
VEEMRRLLESHNAETDSMAKRRRFFEILDGITPENAEATILAWKEARGPLETWATSRMEYSQLMEIWGRTDGEAAMDHAKELGSKLKGWSENSIMQGWGFANPKEALAWVEENRKGDGPLIQQLLWGIAERDIDLATNYLLASPDDVNAGVYTYRLTRQRWTQGVDVATAWADRLPEGAIKARAVDTLAEFIAEQSPKDAASWLAQFAGSESGKQAIQGLAKDWAATNPYGAARWAESLPVGENRALAIRAVVLDWARRRPESAAQYMGKLEPGPTRDTAVVAYAGGLMLSDPESGIAWIESINGANLRNETMVAEGRLWVERDPAAAAAWLRAADLPESVVERIQAE